ncbi:MAG: NAD(P)H-hydrate dehydratase [Woeseiaceae bacterium]
MQDLPTEIFDVAAVREIDRTAIEDRGIPGYTLMTRAAEAAVAEARRRFPAAKRWQVLCGAGNNGGDGYVVARLAAEQGIAVSVLALIDPQQLKGDAATAYGDFAASGGVVMPWQGALDADAELLLDGILGSGLERDVGGEFAACVQALNAHRAPALALDIPTGIHGDSGRLMGCAVKAAATVTFVGLKAGLYLGEAPDYCGDIVFAGLGIPADARSNAKPVLQRLADAAFSSALGRRARGAHKGDFGHILVVGGGPGMPGAVRLCGEAALRAGAGRVSVATHPSHAQMLVASRPELMCHAIEDASELQQLLDKADVIAFGPGLGLSQWARDLYEVVASVQRPAVWDADALNLLAAAPAEMSNRIITPHPGEAATLLEQQTAEVQADRPAALQQLTERYGGVAVLKGAGTLVSAASGVPWLCTAGNPGMAAAGMGDVLSGVIAAMLGQGLPAELAAIVAVEAHARAGDAAAVHGERGLLATELAAELRGIVNP